MTDSSTTVEDGDIDLDVPSGIYPMIDHAIRECSGRGLVSASEMMDILLDIRGLLLKEGIL